MNILLEQLQNATAKTFGSAEINHRSNNDDGNKNKCSHYIGILKAKVQSLRMENSFLKNEIQKPLRRIARYKKNLTVKKHLRNWVMLISALLVLTDSMAIDHQLPSSNNLLFFNWQGFTGQSNKKQNLILEIKNSCTKVFPNNTQSLILPICSKVFERIIYNIKKLLRQQSNISKTVWIKTWWLLPKSASVNHSWHFYFFW